MLIPCVECGHSYCGYSLVKEVECSGQITLYNWIEDEDGYDHPIHICEAHREFRSKFEIE
jgi:hypothetical protein